MDFASLTAGWDDDDQILPERTDQWEAEHRHAIPTDVIDDWIIETGGDVRGYFERMRMEDPEEFAEIEYAAYLAIQGMMQDIASAERARRLLKTRKN